MSTKKPHHVPQGLAPVIAQLVVPDGKKTLAFLAEAFDAKDPMIMAKPDGTGVMHGHVKIGGCAIFVSDVSDFAPRTSSNLFLYVPDVDTTMARAKAAGAKVLAPAMDMFWGDRWGLVQDPDGNHWQLATHVEDVPPDEMMKRMKQAQR